MSFFFFSNYYSNSFPLAKGEPAGPFFHSPRSYIIAYECRGQQGKTAKERLGCLSPFTAFRLAPIAASGIHGHVGGFAGIGDSVTYGLSWLESSAQSFLSNLASGVLITKSQSGLSLA